MNFKIFVTLAVSSLFLTACTNSNTVTLDTSKDEKSQAQAALKIGQIMEKGGQAVCTITSLEADASVTVMSISGKKMKIVGKVGPSATDGVMINDGEYTYLYDTGSTTGMKMKNPTETEAKEMEKDAKKAYEDLPESVKSNEYTSEYDNEEKYKIECKEGNVAASEFVPPANIKFTDPSEMMKQTLKDIPGMPTMPAMPDFQNQE